VKTDVIVRSFGLLTVLGCLVLPAAAQPGSTILSPVDLDAQTGNNGHLGCVELGGAFYVSGRRLTTTAPHQVYVVDGVGTLINHYDQDPGTATSAWGYRDGATDCTSLMWGNEPGIFVTDPSTGALVNTVEAANGTQALAANPITGPGLAALGNYRALAFDPDGNGGNGSFWSGNFGSDLFEVDLDGNILTQHPNGGYSLYGLVLDPVTGRLWGHSSSGAIVEIDKSTGATTGRTWTSPAGAGAQGGLSRVKSSLHKLDLCGVMQGDPGLGGVVDSLFSVQVHRLCSGTALLAGRREVGRAAHREPGPRRVRAQRADPLFAQRSLSRSHRPRPPRPVLGGPSLQPLGRADRQPGGRRQPHDPRLAHRPGDRIHRHRHRRRDRYCDRRADGLLRGDRGPGGDAPGRGV